MLILGFAAIAQAFAPDIAWLIGMRFVLGLGVGADYVLSPVIMAEHSNRADRGRALGLGFGTMWPLGALAAVLFKLSLDAFKVAPDLQWRLVLAAGAVPALGVLYFRRKMPETARYLARLGRRPGAGRRCHPSDQRRLGRRACLGRAAVLGCLRAARPANPRRRPAVDDSTTWWSTPSSSSARR